MPESTEPDIQALLNTRMTAADAAALITAAPVQITALRKTLKEWLDSGEIHIGSNGTPVWNSAGGVNTVTEASAASHYTYTTYIEGEMRSLTPPSFGGPVVDATTNIAKTRRIFNVLLTSDGAGAIAATTLVPALAGYTGHAELVGIFSNATDAATTWTLAVTGGTILGPSVIINALTAGAVTQFGAVAANQDGKPVYIRGTLAADDNKAITIAAAGFAATQTAWCYGYYWYET